MVTGEVKSIEELEETYLPKHVEKYPFIFRRRVTKEEGELLDGYLKSLR